MDVWLELSLSGAAVFCGSALVWEGVKTLRKQRENDRIIREARRLANRPEVTSIPAIDTRVREHVIYPSHPLYARVIAAAVGRSPDEVQADLDGTDYQGTLVERHLGLSAEMQPSDKPKWDACDAQPLDLAPYRLTDTDAADAMPPPPNIGGEGNPPYEGPNYVHEDEVAADMKGIVHYGYEEPPCDDPNCHVAGIQPHWHSD